MTKTNYGRLTAGLIAAWFALSLLASALHLLQTPQGRPPLGLLLAVLTPIAVFSVWYLRSPAFRDYILSLDPRTLTMLHSWRIAGFVFVVLYAYGILPACSHCRPGGETSQLERQHILPRAGWFRIIGGASSRGIYSECWIS